VTLRYDNVIRGWGLAFLDYTSGDSYALGNVKEDGCVTLTILG